MQDRIVRITALFVPKKLLIAEHADHAESIAIERRDITVESVSPSESDALMNFGAIFP